jgi:zinc D-Ala-D-Ala carboxypeptidase
MKITKNFSLEELIKSMTAIRKGIDNSPSSEHLVNLTNVSRMILQPVRDHYGKVVRVNSGYRSPTLNTAVGGSKTSQHCNGEAVDFEIDGLPNVELATWVRDHLDFDQLILEFFNPAEGPNSGWVHCSYRKDGTNRKKIMTALVKNGKTSYLNGFVTK